MKRTLVKNFLNPADHEQIFNVMTSKEFPWYVSNAVAGYDFDTSTKDYYFNHTFYDVHNSRSNYFYLLEPIINQLPELKALVRIKANLYPSTHKVIKHGMHFDQPYDLNACLYYVNTNDGVTTFEDTGDEVKSEANSALFFNSHDMHCSSTCSNEKYRITINLNYF